MSAGILKMNSGMYKCPDHIKNLKIRVKLKKVHSMAKSNEDIDLNITEKEMKTFSWQAKVFSRAEAEFYAKDSNCVTDLEKHYHEMVTKISDSENFGRLFSYVTEDEFDANEESVTTEVNNSMSVLHKEMSNLRLRKKIKDTSNNISSGYEINKFLNNSISNPFTANSYETMYVMADLGDSEPNSNIWLKSEHILCKIKYDENNKLLWIYPDFSANENDTYNLEIDVGGKLYYEYTIENFSETKNLDMINEENEILRKINKRKQDMKTQILGHEFLVPPKNVLRFYVFFEILTARNFEYDNIYVQYNIDLPENWICSDDKCLFGTTQTCKTKGEDNLANFGYYFDVCFECKIQENSEDFPSLPVIYFQVISRDIWDRYRTEGLGYRAIPAFEPGSHEFDVHCMRICPANPSGYLRRFFIGDYFNVDDVSWIGVPKEVEGSTLNKFGIPTIGTGSLSIRLNILHQSKASKRSDERIEAFDTAGASRSNAHSLVKSVGEVIVAFRRAREKMVQARNNILEEE